MVRVFKLSDGSCPGQYDLDARCSRGVVHAMEGCYFEEVDAGIANLVRLNQEGMEIRASYRCAFAQSDGWLTVLDRESRRFFYFFLGPNGRFKHVDLCGSPCPAADHRVASAVEVMQVVDPAESARDIRTAVTPVQQAYTALQGDFVSIKADIGKKDDWNRLMIGFMFSFMAVVAVGFLGVSYQLMLGQNVQRELLARTDREVVVLKNRTDSLDERQKTHDARLEHLQTKVDHIGWMIFTQKNQTEQRALPPSDRHVENAVGPYEPPNEPPKAAEWSTPGRMVYWTLAVPVFYIGLKLLGVFLGPPETRAVRMAFLMACGVLVCLMK